MNTPLSGSRARPGRAVVDVRTALLVVGIVLSVLALGMVPSLVADLAVGHEDWQVFAASAAVTLFVGVALVLENRHAVPRHLGARDAFLVTASVWLATSLFAALPFRLSALGLSWADAVFEAVSGLTTTGSTVLVGLDRMPPGILLWRAVLQWIGGIGIIVMGVAVLPMLNVGGMQLVRTESSDLSEKALPRAGQVAAAIGGVYLALTIACALAYGLAGMGTFDAAVHAMTTVATGGYSTRDASIGAFASPAVEWVAVLFMILGSLPFVLYVLALRGRADRLWRDVQVRWFLGIVAVAWAALFLWVWGQGLLPAAEALRHSLFTVVSLLSTTGYASTDYGTWGSFAVVALFFLISVGGCTGSTTGGIKTFRFAVLYAVARVQIQRLLQPSGIFPALYGERPVSDATATAVLAFVFFFALSFSVVAALLGLLGLDYLTAMSAAITALANVGPGLGPEIGPAGNFAGLPDAAKWILAFAMLLGRLELFTILVLFVPAFWRS